MGKKPFNLYPHSIICNITTRTLCNHIKETIEQALNKKFTTKEYLYNIINIFQKIIYKATCIQLITNVQILRFSSTRESIIQYNKYQMNLKDFAYVTVMAFIPSNEREYIIFYINYKFGQINNTFSSFNIYTTIIIIFKMKIFCKGAHKHNVFNLQILIFQKNQFFLQNISLRFFQNFERDLHMYNQKHFSSTF